MDFAECAIAIKSALRDAEQCERDKLYRAAVVELEEIIFNARRAIEHCFARDAGE